MKATWDIETARTCKIDTIAPEKCEQCRDNKYCFKQMTLFDLLEEYDHGWKKIPDEASVLIHGINVINVIDSGIKKEGNIEFAARGFVNDKQCWIGCVRGSNGEAIAIMYAKDFSEGEQNDIRTKVESAADNQKEV